MSEFKYSVRLMIGMDVGSVIKIERATLGDWSTDELCQIMARRRVFGYVATVQGGKYDVPKVVGFMVMELNKKQGSELAVLNLAATHPEARRLLIEKAKQRAKLHEVCLTWREE